MAQKEQEMIFDLFQKAQFLLDKASDIRNFYRRHKEGQKKFKLMEDNLIRYLIIQHNLYFNEVVVITHTLLQSNLVKKKNRELSIDNLLEKQVSEEEKELKLIRDKYKKTNLDKIRNKIIAHKDEKNTGFVITHTLGLTNENFFKGAQEIIGEIGVFLNKHFNLPYENNLYEDLFADGFKQVLKMIDADLNSKP